MFKKLYITIICICSSSLSWSQTANLSEENIHNLPEHEYHLTIDHQTVNFTGKDIDAITINGGIPGPNLEFTEGEFAVIHVTNNLDHETSVHWHGLILPNFYDGVPYLTTPPIAPGETFTYQFELKQAGTYWYHSHTGLQEQRGVYGSIQINPKEKPVAYDKDLVLVLSDWMDENPASQLKNLKRGNEWYLIKKKQVQSWDKIIKKGAVGAKLKMMWQRMPDFAISDNFYDTFLINGKNQQEYPSFQPGEKVRVRFVNASAASYYWLTFGGANDPMLIASDGQNVVPVAHNKTLIGVAETYDFVVTIPANGKLQVRAMAQDGSGFATATLGEGPLQEAPVVPKPDLIAKMKKMMQMDMKMGAPASKFRPHHKDSVKVMKKYQMKMDNMAMDNMQMGMDGQMAMKKDKKSSDEKPMQMTSDSMMNNSMNSQHSMEMGYKIPAEKVVGSNMKTAGNPQFNYNFLKAPKKTKFDSTKPVKELLFNLTGNMNRYVWSINGVPLSETDKIKIEKGEVVRITLNNLTMMHHPMHLHGHFFRVLNKNGAYSPLKHTVDVAPMQKVVIEFDANEVGDWFFHCHILYHLNSGMARVFSYNTPRDSRMKGYPITGLTNEADHIYTWGTLTAASHMSEFSMTSTNIRNQFNVSAAYGYHNNLEADVSYERYLNDYFRVFGGVSVENEMEDSLEELSTTAVGGIRYLLPLLINSELSMNSKLRPAISLDTETMIFPHIALFGEYEYQMDFGWVDPLEGDANYASETTWQVGLEYIFARNFSIMGSYDNRFGFGGGLVTRF